MWDARKRIAAKYIQELKDVDTITLHTVKTDRESSWHLFPIRLNLEMLSKNRAQIIDELKARNIGVGVHFMPVHQHLYYAETFKLEDKNYPVASAVFPRLISLPIYPGMSDESVYKVVNVLKDILTKFKR